MIMHEQDHGVSREPSITCPHIDNAIKSLEELRNMNSDLRDWGGEWRDKAIRYYDELYDANEYIEELKAEIKELERVLNL